LEVVEMTPEESEGAAPAEEPAPEQGEQEMGDEYVNQGVRNLAGM